MDKELKKYLDCCIETAKTKLNYVYNDHTEEDFNFVISQSQNLMLSIDDEPYIKYIYHTFFEKAFLNHCFTMLMAVHYDSSLLNDYPQCICGSINFFVDTYEGDISLDEAYSIFLECNSIISKILVKEDGKESYKICDRLIDLIFRDKYNSYYRDIVKTDLDILDSLSKNQSDVCERIKKIIECNQNSQTESLCINVYGQWGIGRKTIINKAVKYFEGATYFVSYDKLLGQAHCSSTEIDILLDGIIIECMLLDSVFVLEDMYKDDYGIYTQVISKLFNYFGLFFITSIDKMIYEVGSNQYLTAINVQMLSLSEQRFIWEQMAAKYNVGNDIDITGMPNIFRFTPGRINQALKAADYIRKSMGDEFIDRKQLKEGCYSFVSEKMGNKVVKISADYSFKDIVLPDYSIDLLKCACSQVKNKHKVYGDWDFDSKISYGKGTSIVFAGPPGTGKTMGAQVIANDLGLDLYKVELSAVVSKYIGETEKNLNEIFEQAKKSQIVLFFDEADVLFSKRTEVKDSNDKYSNMEAAFMLQKMEEFDGITILATNYLQNFDEAFKRRMKFIIDFPFPEAAYRLKLWKQAFPDRMPVGDIDFEYLATNFELSGSNIKNIVLHSAFLAADAEEAVNMKHIIAGIKNEYAKSGKILTKNEVLEYYMLL